MRLTFSALRAGDGRRIGLIAACEDLSSIRAMEARMRAADRLASLGRMAANIAHEIRNPLASLSGAVEVLAGGATFDETRDRLVQIVLRESGRLNNIIRELPRVRAAGAAASRVGERGRGPRRGAAAARASGHARARSRWCASSAPSLMWNVDRQQFRQAIWNLCVNAVQAMPEGGELRVTHAR